MISLTLADIAAITGGELAGGADATATVTSTVEFDSRLVRDGSLFVCLPGARADGHDFASAAIAAGAVAVLAARDVDVPAIIVPHVDVPDSTASFYDNDPAGDGASVLEAMSKLARHIVDRAAACGMVTVGVTGSAGKTSTKDMIASVLSAACRNDTDHDDTPSNNHDGDVVAPPGSFNNEIGLPYTALRVTEHTRYLVAEMSARGIGHIAHLTSIVPPHVGVVLNVGTAHLGEFGSRDNIARAKSELPAAVPATGLVILNADDPSVAAMSAVTSAPIITYSAAQPPQPEATVTASTITMDEVARARFTLNINGHTAPVELQVFGLHQVSNALAAAAVGHHAGMSIEHIASALSAHTAASANRMDVQTRRDNVTIINDSYNANPDSMRAGIAALAYTASGRDGATSWAVLGQMAELGADATAEHEAIAEYLAKMRIDRLVAVGQGVNTRALGIAAENAGIRVDFAASADAAVNIVDQNITPHDVVLVKASASEGLWFVAEALIERDRSRRVL